jgi:hypothetical protein
VKVYPRLPRIVAEHLAADLAARTVSELQKLVCTSHPDATYNPTGGTRVDEEELVALRKDVVTLAIRNGYPAAVTDGKKQSFDAECAILLHESMGISASEASCLEVWSFLASCVLPDVARWRFPGTSGTTTEERFLGGSRGLRNAFGRLWWRAYLLREDSESDEFGHVRALGEDELVQVTERPVLAGSRRVNVLLCRAFREAIKSTKQVARSELLRDAMKRFRRLHPVICFDALEDAVVLDMMRKLIGDSSTALRAVGKAS